MPPAVAGYYAVLAVLLFFLKLSVFYSNEKGRGSSKKSKYQILIYINGHVLHIAHGFRCINFDKGCFLKYLYYFSKQNIQECLCCGGAIMM